jgi:chloramphenicol-sensitive protein RarD
MNRNAHPTSAGQQSRSGLVAGLAAYVLWGFLPILFHMLRQVPPLELVAWRVVFTLPVCLVFLTVSKGWGDLAQTLRQPGLVLRLMVSAVLIGTNWTLYVTAVVNGHVLATSLGYYINPLINVLIGTLFLGERLGWRQWSAVAIAGAGIALLMAGAIQMLGTALALAGSFALYGLMRKLTPVKAITGLTIETMVLYPAAVVWALITTQAPHGSSLGQGGLTAALLVGSGLATAVPLILFAVAARHLALSTLGFLQYAAPTIVFLIGVALGEALDRLQLACFVLIWIAVALFVWDIWRKTRALNRPAAS